MTVFKRLGMAAAVAGLAAVGVTAMPHDANAWWRGGVWIPPVVIAPAYVPPPVVYAPPPVVYAPPPVAYVGPPRIWIRPHWNGPYWVRGHWG